MSKWKKAINDFLHTVYPPVFGAGFKKEGVEIGRNPNLISFDGRSVYFFGLMEREAAKFLDGLIILNGYTGWLTYILQELFYDEETGDELYGVIFDGLDSGQIKGLPRLSRDSVYQWVETVAPEVEEIKRSLEERRRASHSVPGI